MLPPPPAHPGETPDGTASPLNVVMIMIDDVGVDQVSCYSRNYPCSECTTQPAPRPCTPNIDAMAANGLRFTNAWSSPVCSPTRAQTLTGKRTSSLGVGRATGPLNLRSGMSTDELTLGDLFPLNGFFGKWHLADATQVYSHPLDCGFFPFAGSMYNLSPLQDGPTYYDWQKYDGLNPPVQTFDYATTVVTDDAIEWIDQLNAGQGPWFVMVSYHAGHSPYHCPALPSQANSCATDWWGGCGTPACQYSIGVCRSRAMVQALDYEIGRLLTRIDRTDTAVVLFGDNGTEAVATALPFNSAHAKATLYQGGINVPMIAQAPGLAPGVNHELVQVADLFTTALDLALVPRPVGVVGLDSVSLAQYLSPIHAAQAAAAGAEEAPRTEVFAEVFEPNFEPEGGTYPADYVAEHHELTLRDQRYKLIELNTLAGGRVEHFYRLFDPSPGAPPLPHDPAISADPFEQSDLMLSQGTWAPAVQAAYDALSARLATYEHLPLTTTMSFTPSALIPSTETVVSGVPSADCSSTSGRAGWVPSEVGAVTFRTFMDFDTTALPDNADVVNLRLDLQVADGFDLAGSTLRISSLVNQAAGAECATLFGSVGPSDFGSASGLTGSQLISISLNPMAETIFEQLASSGQNRFSLSLTFDGEGLTPDVLTLADGTLPHQLFVRYGLKP